MSTRYTSSFPSSSPSAGQAHFGLVGVTARSVQVKEFIMSGLAQSSSTNEIRVNRNTGTFTLTNAITPRPMNTGDVAAVVTAGYPSTAITLGTDMLRFGVNGNGATLRWVAPPGSEIELQGNATAQQMGWVSVTGGVAVAGSTIHLEI